MEANTEGRQQSRVAAHLFGFRHQGLCQALARCDGGIEHTCGVTALDVDHVPQLPRRAGNGSQVAL